MSVKRLLRLLLLLVTVTVFILPALAQQDFPSLSANNTFTGTNSIPICSYPVSLLPTNLSPRTVCIATDANPVCTVGGGTSTPAWCQWNGTSWVTISGGGSSGSGTVGYGSGYSLPAYSSPSTNSVGPSNITTDSTGNNLNVPGKAAVGTTIILADGTMAINARAFGVTGNGSTNDAANMQTWLTKVQSYAISNGSADGYLSPGVYNLAGAGLTLQTIQGVGSYVLTLQGAPNVTIHADGAVLYQPSYDRNYVTFGVVNCPNFHMTGGTIDGGFLYTSSIPVTFFQQGMHVIDSPNIELEYMIFHRLSSNALIVTNQYSTSVTPPTQGAFGDRIHDNLFEQVAEGINTGYGGANSLKITNNTFHNNYITNAKLSTGPLIGSGTTGYAGYLTDVLIANNNITYDSAYVNPSGNTYLTGFDSASLMKNVTWANNVIDFGGQGPSGTIAIRLMYDNGDFSSSPDGNQAPERLTLIGNQIMNMPASSFGVVVTPTMRNLLVTGNRFTADHTALIVQVLGTNLSSWNGLNTIQIDDNQFLDNDQADINMIGLTASRVVVENNTCNLETVSSSLQCLSIDSTSTIGELTIADNQSDKSLVSAAQSTTVNAIGNTVTAQSGTQPLTIYAPAIGSGSKLNLQNNTITGGSDSYFANFATGNAGSGNIWSSQTNGGGAVQFSNITTLNLDKPRIISPAGVYMLFGGTTTAYGTVMGPYASFSGITMAVGSHAERTDGYFANETYTYESTGWRNIDAATYATNPSQNTVNLLGGFGYYPLNPYDRQINMVQYANSTTAIQGFMLDGTWGPSSTLTTPTCISLTAPCTGIMADDNGGYIVSGQGGDGVTEYTLNKMVTITPTMVTIPAITLSSVALSNANCLSATTVSVPCLAYQKNAYSLGTSGTSGTMTLYTSNAPANAKFQVCSGIEVATGGSAGNAVMTATTWTTASGITDGGYGLSTTALTSSNTINTSCQFISVAANSTLAITIAASGATGSPSWGYNFTATRLY